MIKVSGGYVGINPNFVINDIPQKHDIDEKTQGLVAILRNILFRGTPTKPSIYLVEKLGSNTRTGGYLYTTYTNKLHWDRKIKGGISNPALNFYEKMWEEIPDIAATFLPECPLNQIVYKEDLSDRYSVDFYSPFYAISIEIDGPHHDEKLQQISDDERDNLILKACADKPIRVKVQNTQNIVNSIISKIGSSAPVNKAKCISINNISNSHKSYMYVIRYQSILLELIENGCITFNDDIYKLNLVVPSEDEELAQLAFNYAYEDLKLWFGHLFSLLNEDVTFPDIEISSDEAVVIDVDPYNRYDDNFFSSNGTICVRNDYFLYDKDAFAKTQQEAEATDKYAPTTYSCSKNYYSVAISDLRFTEISPYNPKHKESLKFFLNNIFGHDDFRPKQLEIISYGLDPKNGVVGILPTGSGKSVCYQLISFLTPGVTLVVAPLKLLMDDQKANLFKRNLIMTAYQIHAEEYLNKTVAKHNQAKILYISPERFFDETFKPVLEKMPIAQIAIDEVHCLSEWGHDFRTSYLLLLHFFKNYPPNTLLIGTTATASPNVINDIEKEFSRLKPNNFQKVHADSVKRPELTFEVKRVYGDEEVKNAIREIADKNSKEEIKTIIFCAYTVTPQKIKEDILSGYRSHIYHGKLEENEKKNSYNSFSKSKQSFMIATKAFGMGIDINDIHATVHYDIASSVESLYQEMGRAGRDGEPSKCYVILNTLNSKNASHLFEYEFNIDQIKKVQEKDQYFNKYTPISRPLSLMMASNENHEKWADAIYDLYIFLKNRDSNEPISAIDIVQYCPSLAPNPKDDKKEKIDKALYKLYTLGLIDLWGMSYSNGLSNPLYTNLCIKDLSISSIKDNLEFFIRKYDYKYSYAGLESVNGFLKGLCKWDNDTFLRYRWESLKTLYKMLSEFKDSETFANRIDAFFSMSETIDSIIRNPDSKYEDWFTILFGNASSLLKDQLSRYSGELQNNSTLDFLLAMIAFKEEKQSKHVFKKLVSIINSIPKPETNRFLTTCIQYFNDDNKAQERFLIFLTDNFPKWMKRKEIKDVLNTYGNDLKTQISNRIQYNEIYDSLNKLKKTLGDF